MFTGSSSSPRCLTRRKRLRLLPAWDRTKSSKIATPKQETTLTWQHETLLDPFYVHVDEYPVAYRNFGGPRFPAWTICAGHDSTGLDYCGSVGCDWIRWIRWIRWTGCAQVCVSLSPNS